MINKFNVPSALETVPKESQLINLTFQTHQFNLQFHFLARLNSSSAYVYPGRKRLRLKWFLLNELSWMSLSQDLIWKKGSICVNFSCVLSQPDELHFYKKRKLHLLISQLIPRRKAIILTAENFKRTVGCISKINLWWWRHNWLCYRYKHGWSVKDSLSKWKSGHWDRGQGVTVIYLPQNTSSTYCSWPTDEDY